MSLMVPPPVARHGLPQKPVNQRKTRNMATFEAKPTGSWKMIKRRRVQKKIPLRPTFGISDMGDQSIGPRPYPLEIIWILAIVSISFKDLSIGEEFLTM